MRKNLDVALAGDHFLDKAVDACRVLLLLAVAAAAFLRNAAHNDDDNCRQHDHQRKQLHRQRQHHADRTEQRGHGDQHLRNGVLQKLICRLDVVCEIAHEAAVGVRVKIADGQSLHLGEQLRAQRAHNDRAALEHQPVEQIIRHRAERVQARKPEQQRQILRVYLAGRKAGLLEQIHERLHAVGGRDRRRHIDQNRRDRADHNGTAMPEIAEQAQEATEGRARLAVIPQLNSGHLRSPPASSGCHKRRGRSGCAPSARHACRYRTAFPRQAQECGRSSGSTRCAGQ